MKRTLKSLFAMACAIVLASCNQSQKYSLDWDLSSLTDQGVTIDSVNVLIGDKVIQKVTENLNDGKIHIEGEVDEPTIAQLVCHISYEGETQEAPTDVILEEGNLKFNDLGVAEGSPLNNAISELFQKLFDEYQKSDANEENVNSLIENFIKAHKNDVSAVYMLANANKFVNLSHAKLRELHGLLSKDMQKQAKAVELIEKLNLADKTGEGNMFVDFEAEYEGKTTKLSDYVGKGKYVLVDFWASWCGPCRMEIPNLINAYEKYAGDNFEVLGVASWDKPEDTKKAIEELKIPYPQIMNAQSAGTDAYSIEGIPEIILFAPDGTILKRGLREEAIEAAVKEALEAK